MRKSKNRGFIVFVLLLGVLFVLSGCGDKGFKESFTGSWGASENSLNGNIHTGNITFQVEEDGAFILSDNMGTVNMKGKLKVKDDEKIELECESENFAPPLCWGISEKEQFKYDFVTADVVVIEYEGNSIAFFRSVENIATEELMNINWLTNNGIDTEDVTYRVAMTHNDINFYILDGDQIVRILYGRNLKYDNEKGQISFVPDTSVGFEPPYVWFSDMGEKIQEIILEVEFQDNSMTLTYNDVPITFYNDLMYQMDSETEVYRLFENTWAYQSENHQYEIKFALGDTVFASCIDETGTEYFYGAALIDETQSKIILYVEMINQTTDLWGGIATEMGMIYQLSEDKLTLNYNGQELILTAK